MIGSALYLLLCETLKLCAEIIVALIIFVRNVYRTFQNKSKAEMIDTERKV